MDLDGTLVTSNTVQVTKELFPTIEPDLSLPFDSREGIATVITGSSIGSFFKKRYNDDYFPFLPTILATSGGGEVYLLCDAPEQTEPRKRYVELTGFSRLMQERLKLFNRNELVQELEENLIGRFSSPKFTLKIRKGYGADIPNSKESTGRIILQAIPRDQGNINSADQAEIASTVLDELEKLFPSKKFSNLTKLSLFVSDPNSREVRFNLSPYNKGTVIDYLADNVFKGWNLLGAGDGGNDSYLAQSILKRPSGIFLRVDESDPELLELLSEDYCKSDQVGQFHIAQLENGSRIVFPRVGQRGPESLRQFLIWEREAGVQWWGDESCLGWCYLPNDFRNNTLQPLS